MKREVPELIPPEAPSINLGAGISHIPGAVSLDYPEWNGETDQIPYEDGSIGTIYAFHFFEHFSGTHAIRLLRECERVLKPGGTLNVVVPRAGSSIANHDLDHKSFWNEDTWKTLFKTPYYVKNREASWGFKIGLNLIIGIVERNLVIMTQLVKEER